MDITGMADTMIGGMIFSALMTSCITLPDSNDFEITCSSCSSRESCDTNSLGRCCCGSMRSCGALDLRLVNAAAVKYP